MFYFNPRRNAGKLENDKREIYLLCVTCYLVNFVLVPCSQFFYLSFLLFPVLTICFGIQLGKASTPNSAVYVMVGCVLYQVLLGVTLEVLKFIEKRKLEKGNAVSRD